MTSSIPLERPLAHLTAQILQQAKRRKRTIVAIAGPPAVGKSTVARKLAKSLASTMSVAVVGMDGFHFDNNLLESRNHLARKGAPDTFDVEGLRALLQRLTNQEADIAVPVFDRKLDLSRASAGLVKPADSIVLVEGNYLLVNEQPWHTLSHFFDWRVYLRASMQTLQQRLIQRWLDHQHTEAEAVQRAQSNDLPNAQFVVDHTTEWDIQLKEEASQTSGNIEN